MEEKRRKVIAEMKRMFDDFKQEVKRNALKMTSIMSKKTK